MIKTVVLLLVFLFIGCAGTGFTKKCTITPDEVWLQEEVSPTGSVRDYKTSKIIGGVKWKLQ